MKKKRIVIAVAAAVAIVVALVISISCFSLISYGPERNSFGGRYLGACHSIALFGKLEIAGVDKVVISSGDKSLTITDPDLVEQIVDKTKVASWGYNVGCGCCEQRGWKIDLYRGDWLVRSMDWVEDDIVKVYNRDLTHWVYNVEVEYLRFDIAGYARLSGELEIKLVEMFTNAQ